MDDFLAGCERRMYRLALLATGSRDEALDIVQDAMYKLVRRYAHRSASEWPPLMHRILQTTILDWYRRGGVRRRSSISFSPAGEEGGRDVEALPAAGRQDPERQLAGWRLAERLDQALCRLPLRQQQVFLLRAWEGLSVAETARAMGCGEGSVKTHYSRAMHSLRRMLGDEWGNEQDESGNKSGGRLP